MPEPDIEALRREIEGRFASVHAFCRVNGHLNRSTVYMVLNGRYAGNMKRQAERIRAALDGRGDKERDVMEAIKGVACSKCAVKARPCGRCDNLFRAQARAVMQISQVG